MSVMETDNWIEWAWGEYSKDYLKECAANGWQADLGDFWVYLEDRNLIPEDIDG